MGVYAGPANAWSNFTDENRIDASTKVVVQDGLVLNLDAGASTSYPGSGTSWSDLSGNGNTGTLTNGPTYSSDDGGSIVFDSVNDYASVSSSASIPYGASARTISIWFYTNSTSWASNVNTLFFYGAGSIGQAFGIDMDVYPKMEVFTWGGAGRDITFDTTYSQVGWKNICVTYNGSTTILIYENGVFTQTSTLSDTCNTLSSNVYIGAINPSDNHPYYDGNIAQVSIYNSALTAAEIQHNFSALRGRYGI